MMKKIPFREVKKIKPPVFNGDTEGDQRPEGWILGVETLS